MKIKILLGLLIAAVVALPGLSACSPAHADVYPPTSYGQYYGNAWHCYYVSDPAEAAALIRAGHCHAGDIATPMPLWWHERYYAYYSWPGYYNHFVPSYQRTTFVNVQVNQFGSKYRSGIQSQSRLATYRGPKGKTISGTKVKPKFTSGTSSKRYGGGNARTGGGTTSRSKSTGSGSRYGSGSSRTRSGSGFGGGSSRSGGSFGGGSSRRR